MQNEYKFYATIFSVKKLIILYFICLPIIMVAVILIYLCFSNNIDLGIISIICLSLYLPSFIASFRQVKIVLNENSITIYYWGKLKHKAPIEDFKYIQGIDINKEAQRASIELAFRNKSFIFSLWGVRGASISNDTKLIKMLTNKYQLRKEFFGKKVLFIDIFQYVNPQYKR